MRVLHTSFESKGIAMGDATILMQSSEYVRGFTARGATKPLSLGQLLFNDPGVGNFPHPPIQNPGACPPPPRRWVCKQFYSPVRPDFIFWGGGNTVWFLPDGLDKLGLISQR
jgi:hypothetical protein